MNIRTQYAVFGLLLLLAIAAGIWTRDDVQLAFVGTVLASTPEEIVEVGNQHFDARLSTYDIDRAEYYFKKAVRMDPLVPDALHQLARIKFVKGDFEDALFFINKQIDNHGEGLMSSYYVRGLIYGFMGEYDLAIEDYKLFLEWDPINWATHNDLAWVYFSNGDYKNSADISEQGLALFPRNAWLLNMHGVSHLNLGNISMAKESLEQARIEADKLTELDWHISYPGNHPKHAEQGLIEMKEAIDVNLALLEEA